MGFQDVIRFLLPRAEHFYDFLEKQAELAHEASKAFVKFADGEATVDETLEVVEKQEVDGDSVVAEMEDALSRTFVTPIDREDLHHLSAQLDDVLDFTYETVRACSLLGVDKPNESITGLVHVLVDCTEVIHKAIPQLRKHAYADIMTNARTLRKCESKADKIYRHGVSALFADSDEDEPRPARVLIREKTVLDDLERAIDHCDTVADTLTNLAVKHG